MGVTRMGKTTIFLADDDEGVRRTLRTFFEGLPGYRVVGEACDGMEAVEGCRASAPDVALLDIQMPLLDGVSVARQVLADRAAKCVIILTAFSDREHIERVQACGAAGYLTKPFEAEKILPTIELCIARSKEYYLLNKEYQHLSRRCQNREPIDQAKLLLMETRGMREDEAYQYIRELSRRKGMSMARVASYLLAQQEKGRIAAVVPGERFTIFDETTRRALQQYPHLRQDRDLERANMGVTFVFMRRF